TMIDWESGIFSALRPILKAYRKELTDAELLQLYAELELDAEQKDYLVYRDVLNFVVQGFGTRLGFAPPISKRDRWPIRLRDGSHFRTRLVRCSGSKPNTSWRSFQTSMTICLRRLRRSSTSNSMP